MRLGDLSGEGDAGGAVGLPTGASRGSFYSSDPALPRQAAREKGGLGLEGFPQVGEALGGDGLGIGGVVEDFHRDEARVADFA